jgi:drug/metabolite transporter (DMT)-like permease
MGLVWGIPYLLIKVAVGELSPPTLVLGRCLIGSAILLPMAAVRGEIRPLLPYWKVILLYTVVEVSGPWLLLSHAEQSLPSSLTALIVAGVPLIGAVLAWRTGGRDRLDGRALVGLVLGLLGVALLVGLDVSVRDWLAVVEVALVALGYALGPLIISRRLTHAPVYGVIAASLVLTAIIYIPPGVLLAPAHVPSLQVIAAVVGLGVVCTAVAFIAFFALISEVGPVRATVITYVNPAVALLLGVVLLAEPLTLGASGGFVLILAGSALTARRAQEAPLPAVAEP